MAYTSIIPVSRLDNSITYIRNKDKTTKERAECRLSGRSHRLRHESGQDGAFRF